MKFFKTLFIALPISILMWLMIGGVCFATDYYIDQSCTTGGTGTSQTCDGADGPFKTIAAAQVAVTGDQHGNRLLIKRGTPAPTYREMYTMPANGTAASQFTFGAYGTGDDPIIDAGDLKSWTQGEGSSTEESGGLFVSGLESDVTPPNTFTPKWASVTVNNFVHSISTDFAAHGTYSYKIANTGTAGNAYLYKSITEMGLGDTYYFRVYFYYPSGSLGNSKQINYLKLVDGAADSLIVNLKTNAGGVVATLGSYDMIGSQAITPDVAVTVPADDWNCIEVSYKIHATEGGSVVWINGSQISSVLNKDTSASVGIDGFRVGEDYWAGPPASGSSMYFDDIKVANSGPIGVFVDTGVPTTNWYCEQVDDPLLVVFGTTKGTKVATLANCDATNEWFYDSGNITLYVYAGSDPAASVSVGTRDHAIYANNKDYITIDGFDLRGGKDGTLDFVDCDYAVIQNNTIRFGYNTALKGGGIEFSGDNGLITGNEIAHLVGTGMNIHCDADNSTTHNTVSHNEIHHTTEMGAHTVDTNTQYIVFEYNEVHYISGSDSGQSTGLEHDQNSSHITSRYNLIYDCGDAGIVVHNSDNSLVHTNVIYNCGQTNLRPGMWTLANAETSQTESEWYNNTVWNCSGGAMWIQEEHTNLKIKNNLLILNTGNLPRVIMLPGGFTLSGLEIDYNDYYSTVGGDVWRYNDTQYSFEDWKIQISQDANSINSNPLFVSIITPNFHLQPSSPAINAGVDVGLTEDYEGNPVPAKHRAVRKPDIGAYEYQYKFTPD